jgi:small membrane protein
MIAQAVLSMLLCSVLVYAWVEYRRSPIVALMSGAAALAGLYFVWFPSHSTQLAELVGIGRGADLILYIWVCISLVILLNLHLKLRTQHELITALARAIALANAGSQGTTLSRDTPPLNPVMDEAARGWCPASADGHKSTQTDDRTV